jgi:hypothetical protein
LKLRWLATIAVFFRPDEAEKTMKTTGVFLYSRGETFLWWCGDFPARFLANRWSILVDLMSRILMVVVLTVVDG